jgi:hypothetical protein
MTKYCVVEDVKEFVGEDNIPDWVTDSIIEKWITQASVFINKITEKDFTFCNIVDSTANSDDDCVLIGEATYLLVSAKLVKRAGIDRLNNTGIVASGNVKKYSLGALSVEKDIASKSSTNSESTVNIYDLIIGEADKILALYGASVDDDTVWASSINVEAENGIESLSSKLYLYNSFFNED